MARRSRSRDLAGLAALGALAYNFLGPGRDRKDGTLATVEDRSRYVDRAGNAVTSALAMGEPDYSAELGEYRRRTSPAKTAPAEVMASEDASDFLSRRLRVNPETGEAYSMDNLSPMSRARVAAAAGRAAATRRYAEDEALANRVVPAADLISAAYGDPSRRRDVMPQARTAPAQATAPQAQRMTREEMISQIPTGGTRTVEGGDRVSGNEFTRNVGNIVTGLGPAKLAGFGKAGAEMATARGAAQRAAEARAAAKAAEGREAVTNPMAWMAGPKGMKKMQAAEDAERKARRAIEGRRDPRLAVKGEESDVTGGAIGYKKGGAAKVKPKKMASGGMTSKVSSASKRADGIATKGKTKCKIY